MGGVKSLVETTSGRSGNGIAFPVFYDQDRGQGYIFAPLSKIRAAACKLPGL